MAVSRTRPSGLRNLEAFNIPLGIWLIASTYLLQFTVWEGARINNGIFGALILGMAMTRLAVRDPRYWWLSLGNVILGIWVALSPFVLGFFVSPIPTINNVVVGVLVALLALAGLVGSRR